MNLGTYSFRQFFLYNIESITSSALMLFDLSEAINVGVKEGFPLKSVLYFEKFFIISCFRRLSILAHL